MTTPRAISDYALIGDCETAALVGRDGSIDWLCWPRFDSDACFSALLGTPEHGRWLLAPKGKARKVSRRYRDNTLVLETRFETADGAVTVTDFMPGQQSGSSVVRVVTGIAGSVAMTMELVLRFGYGETVPWMTRLEDGTRRAIAGPDMVLFRAPVPLHGRHFKTVSEFSVSAGEIFPFTLSYSPSHLPPPPFADALAQLKETEIFWTDWIGRSLASGPWAGAINRSLITLKALTYVTTGGIIAAPTTSLPERIGGERNWDYRFCWLRDATLTLLALMNAGYIEEAKSWREWLLRAAAGRPEQLQIMYGVAGERRLTEWTVPWLPGFRDSGPVRIGNAAHTQLQLDVFGELMDAGYQARCHGLVRDTSGRDLQHVLLDHLETIWSGPDEGIWEVRGGPQHFVHSKVMAWLAFDRAIKSAEQFHLDGPVDRWKEVCGQIKDDVCRHGFDAKLGTFVRSYGSTDLDASLLMLPAVGFLPPDDPRIRGTIAAIEKRLVVDGMVMRYDTRQASDGLPPKEGAFLACSFWLVDAYVLMGRRDDAVRLFERLLALCNDVGLLSEEYDPVAKEALGNFPQALSHLALVNSAFNLSHAVKPAEQRACTSVARDSAPALQGVSAPP